jgi:hypothetical protein
VPTTTPCQDPSEPAADVLAALDQPAHRVVLRMFLRGTPGGPRDHGEPHGQPQHDDYDDSGRGS